MTADLDPGIVRRLADMHAVYRMWDHAGRLLYIGMSGRAGRRFDQHAEKRWFPLVSTITLEWYATHAQARLAELRAIADEKPRYNIAGSPIAKRAQRGEAVKPDLPESPQTIILADVLRIFGESSGMHWRVIAEQLAARFPHRYRGMTPDVVSAQCRSLGIPSVTVSTRTDAGRAVQKGCRRADVESAATRLLLAS